MVAIMKEKQIAIDDVLYGTLVRCFESNKRVNVALKYFYQMRDSGMKGCCSSP
jgi:pentatricopeptide repeat protein